MSQWFYICVAVCFASFSFSLAIGDACSPPEAPESTEAQVIRACKTACFTEGVKEASMAADGTATCICGGC